LLQIFGGGFIGMCVITLCNSGKMFCSMRGETVLFDP
jgi:hypothetical protein